MKLVIQVVIGVLLCVVTISGMRVPIPPAGNVNSKSEFSTLSRKLHRSGDVWIAQDLDHSDESNPRIMLMRFQVNDKYFADGGALFVYVGSVGEVNRFWIENGHFHDIAKENHGYLVTLEHRYYGKSVPGSNLALENLKYLSINQTLGDMARVIEVIKREVPNLENAKVIMAGGSYGGSLVVWFNRLYPELVDGSWASSAPLLAKANFYEKSEVVGKAIQVLGSQDCYDRIKNGFAELEKMLANNRSAEVKNLFNLCPDFDGNNQLDVATLFATATLPFTEEIMNGTERTISEMCSDIMGISDNLTAVAKVFLRYYDDDETTCIDHASYGGAMKELNNITDTSGNLRQWGYIACNEVGWFQTSESRNQPFGSSVPISLFTATCADIYGNKYTNSLIDQNTENTNKFFGGLNPNVKNVHLTYGEFDPWRPVGAALEATIIPRATTASDLRSINEYDSHSQIASKEKVARIIREWLAKKP